MNRRSIATLVMAVLLGLDVLLILALLNYANGAMECWRIAAMGLDIGCPSEISIWAWIGTLVAACALITGLIVVRRRSPS